jgi:hypothetical protein
MKAIHKLLALLGIVLALVSMAGSAHAADKKKAKDHTTQDAPAPAPTTATPAPDEGAETAEHAEHAEHAKAEEHHGPTTMRVGLSLEKLAKFELGPGTYTTEFVVTFTCDHEPCKPDFDVTNGKITGKEKVVDEKLEKVFRVKAELEALVDLSEFPFDKHVLYVGLADKGDPFNVKYAIDEKSSEVDPDVKLAGWQIDPQLAGDVDTHKIDAQHELQEAQFGIGISRPRVAAFFKTLVPVCFMIFVAGFTLLLKPKSASGRLSAATAGLMTVVMFHLSSTSSLPPLGYLTRMDKFMIATYVVYLVNIALAVAIVRFDEKKNEKMAELTYLVAGGLVPGVALLAWLTVFLKVA